MNPFNYFSRRREEIPNEIDKRCLLIRIGRRIVPILIPQNGFESDRALARCIGQIANSDDESVAGMFRKDNVYIPLSTIRADPASFAGVLFSLEMPRGDEHGGEVLEKSTGWNGQIVLCGSIGAAVIYYYLSTTERIIYHTIICALVGFILITRHNEKAQRSSEEKSNPAKRNATQPEARTITDRHNVIQIYATGDGKNQDGSSTVVFLLLVCVPLLVIIGVCLIESKSRSELFEMIHMPLQRLSDMYYGTQPLFHDEF